VDTTVSALKMETVCFSETLASTDESTRRQNPEKHNQSTACLPCYTLVTKAYKYCCIYGCFLNGTFCRTRLDPLRFNSGRSHKDRVTLKKSVGVDRR
jgi:hypothetical protein